MKWKGLIVVFIRIKNVNFKSKRNGLAWLVSRLVEVTKVTQYWGEQRDTQD